MMKLSLIKEIFKHINQDWDCPITGKFLRKWSPGEDWAKIIRASSNALGIAGFQEDVYIIRFNYQEESDALQWQEEIRFQQALKQAGVPVTDPLPSLQGNWVEQLDTHGGSFIGCCFTQAEGKHLEMEDLTLRHYFLWGESLGQFHRASAEIKGITRKNQQEWLEELLRESPPRGQEEMKEVRWVEQRLKTLPRDGQTYGLIHYDLELDNLFWDDHEIQIIDLDDCLYSWFAADMAYALRDLFNQGFRLDLTLPEAVEFLRGYRKEFPLEEFWLNRMEDFYRIHHYFSYKRIERSLDLEEGPDDPQWMDGLRENLKGMQKSMKRF